MENKYLPIGTVVLLKGAQQKVMITGFCCIKDGKMFDYTACMYPTGYVSRNQMLLFNNDQIDKLIQMGYADEEDEEFKKVLEELRKKYEEKEEGSNNAN